MKQVGNKKYSGVVFWMFCCVFTVAALCVATSAQSSDVAFPTAITENQVNGLIKARDLGDPRITNYYYTFNGLQGDLFINVVTKNLSGSVDVFLVDGMRPLANIIVYADVVQSETGRVIYLRKPDKLILRVQGRTPNDDPAEFQIKFAGGFEAATPTADEPPVPKVTGVGEINSGVRVNSVGTIIAVVPKPRPTPKATPTEIAKVEDRSEENSKPVDNKGKNEAAETTVNEKPTESAEIKNPESETKEPVATETKISSPKQKTPGRKSTRAKANQTTANTPPVEAKPNSEPSDSEKKPETAEAQTRTKPEVIVTDTTAKADSRPKKEPPGPKPNPLANVKLVILFKDGSKVERPMTEVFRFTADQTTLTVISTNGRIAKFPILDVASVTIQ